MPRSPSARALSNTVDLYRFVGKQDEDAGLSDVPGDAYALTPFAAAVACSVQPDDPLRFLDDRTGRLVEKTPYTIFFSTDYSLDLNDKIVWTDDAGATRNLFVFGTANQAGKGGVFAVTAEERL